MALQMIAGATAVAESEDTSAGPAPGCEPAPINQATWRRRICITGRISAVRVHETEAGPSLGCEIVDEAGSLFLVFPGRRRIPGIEMGARLMVEGMVGIWRRRLAILNPYYELVGG